MPQLLLIPFEEFQRVRASSATEKDKLRLIADMSRLNTLTAIKLAGSGHLGSSLSAMDIVVWLYEKEMNTVSVGVDSPDRDIYFSSKGHDVPGLYAVFHSHGILSEAELCMLRKFGGLDGHPDVGVRGIESNTGSLGMGISKGRGMAMAKKFQGYGGRVFVMLGDGELQEGQIYESMQTTANQHPGGLFTIVDHNKVQTDRFVDDITPLGDLEAKFSGFGWNVLRCDGHDFDALEQSLKEMKADTSRPSILIADTIKGKGISFMEHPATMTGGDLYPWHSGAPADDAYERARDEILNRIREAFASQDLGQPITKDVSPETKPAGAMKASAEFVARGFGDELVDLGKVHPNLVVLDGDLEGDCKLREFRAAFPDRFIENGIAEQDMVSMAGGLARGGMIPVVNTFGSFLSARANEQIYNNACEHTKIVYAVHFAGMIPAGPGKSHQSVRDISLFGALPNCVIFQPCNAEEAKLGLRYFVEEPGEACVLRMNIGPSPRAIELPSGHKLREGVGTTLRKGADAILFTYGPVMLHEALSAADHLSTQGFELTVVNMPWLNRVDASWLALTLDKCPGVFVLEDHSWFGGLSTSLQDTMIENGLLEGRKLINLGLREYPACGAPLDVLRHHGLDAASLAERILGDRIATSAVVGEYTEAAPQ